jgi:hypothetical protein
MARNLGCRNVATEDPFRIMIGSSTEQISELTAFGVRELESNLQGLFGIARAVERHYNLFEHAHSPASLSESVMKVENPTTHNRFTAR